MIPALQSTVFAGLTAGMFAVLAFFSGTDRYSEFQPAATRFVAAPFQADSSLADASRALLRGEFDRAEVLAREAVSASPADARGIALLASARELAGDAEGAEASFAVAAKLGHREPLTQSYWFAKSLQSGNADKAAIHLDAILRAKPDFAPAQGYLAMLEASPDGRRALADRLRGDAHWSATYLAANSLSLETLRLRASFLSGGQGAVPQIGCDRILPMIRSIAKRGYRGEAEALAQAQCPSVAAQGLVADPEFDAIGGEQEPAFGWVRHATGDVRASRLSGDRARVELENRSSVTRLVLSQPVALERGSYLIKVKVDGPGGQRVAASLDCSSPKRPSLRRASVDREGWVIEAEDCPDALLGIWLRPGTGRVVIDRVDLTPTS